MDQKGSAMQSKDREELDRLLWQRWMSGIWKSGSLSRKAAMHRPITVWRGQWRHIKKKSRARYTTAGVTYILPSNVAQKLILTLLKESPSSM